MENIIEFKNVNKYYGKHQVIHNVSFSIKEHSICGFIGPNGAGKTTIIKLLLDIINPNSGEITMNGKPGCEHDLLGAIVGGPSYYGNLSASKNMEIVYCMKNISPKKEEIKELLELVGLGEVGNKKVRHFSLGMKQRLCIALSLIGNPKLLIWDEPINGLDPEGIIEIRNIIKNIHKERKVTFLISSHILSELDKIAEEIILINHGQIMYNGSFEHFLNEYRSESLEESYIKCINGERR